MKLEVLKYLADIQYSVSKLEDYSRELVSFDAFTKHSMLIDALERRLSIIGEALYQANKLSRGLPITDKEKIMGLRHILVHDYDKVKPETIYAIVTKNIGLLKNEVDTILSQNPAQGPMTLDD